MHINNFHLLTAEIREIGDDDISFPIYLE